MIYLAVALYDYAPTAGSANCFAFQAGDSFTVHRQDTSGWFDVSREDGKRAWVPGNFLGRSDDSESMATGPLEEANMEPRPVSGAALEGAYLGVESAEHPLIEPVIHAVGLLHYAVDSDCPSQFQPSTACVISSIRALLSATDCLTRDSPTLHANPSIARHRKTILSILAVLVTQARKSGAATTEEANDGVETQSMLDMADKVLVCVREFIADAAHHGIVKAQAGGQATLGIDLGRAALRLRTPTSPLTPLNGSNGWANGASTSSNASSDGPLTPSPDSPAASGPSTSLLCQDPLDGLDQFNQLSDSLIGLVAAFTGHAHAHTTESHAIWQMQLLEHSRETVELVQAALAIVDSLIARFTLQNHLTPPRERLFLSTSALVTATRAATTTAGRARRDGLALGSEEGGEPQELLRSATSILRALDELSRALRRAKLANFDPVALAVPFPLSDHLGLDLPHNAHRRALRERHTLSVLARKATSLACLRETFEQDVSRAMSPTASSEGEPRSSSEGEAPSSSLGSHATALPASATMSRDELSRTSDATTASSSSASATANSDTSLDSSPSTSLAPSHRRSGRDEAIGKTGLADYLDRDYGPAEVAFNSDGVVLAGSLRCLVERLSLHDALADPTFVKTFWLTFRLFTTPLTLCSALVERFNLPIPSSMLDTERAIWQAQKATPIRLRIYNLLKSWLELHWRAATDAVIVGPLRRFVREEMVSAMSAAAVQRLSGLLEKRAIETRGGPSMRPRVISRATSSEVLRMGKPMVDQGRPSVEAPPLPILGRGLLSSLRQVDAAQRVYVLDFDPLELARQLTILCMKRYLAVLPEELLEGGFNRASASSAINVKALSAFSTRLTGWIAETILGEQSTSKRAQLLKYFIKLAERSYALQSFEVMFSIMAALQSSTIARLKRTWDVLSAKYTATMRQLRSVTDHAKNYAVYRACIRAACPPAMPFIAVALSDVVFAQEGNPPTRMSPLDPQLELINMQRYHYLARIVTELQRLQVPYALTEVPEVMDWVQHALTSLEAGGDADRLYRRSLLLEPRVSITDGRVKPFSEPRWQRSLPPLPSS